MPRNSILERIRLLMPAELDGHYDRIRRGFEDGDLTSPILVPSDIDLARAISEFCGHVTDQAPIAKLEARLNPTIAAKGRPFSPKLARVGYS